MVAPYKGSHGSFMIWANPDVRFDRQILIDDVRQTGSDWFESMILVDSIRNPYAREVGYIYLRTTPKVDVSRSWKEYVLDRKNAFNFK